MTRDPRAFFLDDSQLCPIDFVFGWTSEDAYSSDSLMVLTQNAIYDFKTIAGIYRHDFFLLMEDPRFKDVSYTCKVVENDLYTLFNFFSVELIILVVACCLLFLVVGVAESKIKLNVNIFKLSFWVSFVSLFFVLFLLRMESFKFSLTVGRQFFLSDFVLLFKIFLTILMIIYLVYSYLNFVDQGVSRPEFFVVCLFFLFFSFIFSMVTDFIYFYIGLEGLSFVLFYILSLGKYRQHSGEAVFKYFLLSSIASSILIFGVWWVYYSFGSVNFFDLYWIILGSYFVKPLTYEYYIGFLIILVGLFFKLGVVPFHMWISDVYEGVDGNVVLFLATINKVVIIFALLNLVYFFRDVLLVFQSVFFWFGCLSLIVGVSSGFYQTSYRRIVAFSGVTTMGFLLVLYGLFTYYGLFAFLVYFVFYILLIFTFFGIILSIRERTNRFPLRNSWESFWIYYLSPIVSYIFLFLLFALIGIPPLGFFFVKYLMFIAVLIARELFFVIFFLICSVIAVVYYLRNARSIIFRLSAGSREFVSLHFFYVYFAIVGLYLVLFFFIFEYRTFLGFESFLSDFWLLNVHLGNELDFYVRKFLSIESMIKRLEELRDMAYFAPKDVFLYKERFNELFSESEILRWKEACIQEQVTHKNDFMWSSIIYNWLVTLSDPKVIDPHSAGFGSKILLKH